MSDLWLPWATKIDLTHQAGNGPFDPGMCLGVVDHVNAGRTQPGFYQSGGGPASVCPTVQIDYDGNTWQFLPLNWSPWCQSAGNGGKHSPGYGAMETAGQPWEPNTAQQLAAKVLIVRAYHEQLGMPLQLALKPGDHGYGWHGMGGNAWGGHFGCPGDIRRAQMPAILAAAGGNPPPPHDEGDVMAGAMLITDSDRLAEFLYYPVTGTVKYLHSNDTVTNTRNVDASAINPAGPAIWNNGDLADHLGITLDQLGAFLAPLRAAAKK